MLVFLTVDSKRTGRVGFVEEEINCWKCGTPAMVSHLYQSEQQSGTGKSGQLHKFP